MVLVEFVDFYSKFLIALILTRLAQIALRNTWISPALGALHT